MWFYCKDISLADENPLPGYRAERLDSSYQLTEKLITAEYKLVPTIRKVQALLGNGLTGVDLIRCWVTWRIVPLSRRPDLMCTYTGGIDDPLRHSSLRLTKQGIVEMAQRL